MTDWATVATDLLRHQKSDAHDERRSFDRVDAPPRVCARVVTDRQASRTVALIKDLSVTGVGLTLGLALTAGQFIIIEIAMGERSQLMLARVAHCRRLDEGLFQAGAEFFEEHPPTMGPAGTPPEWLAYLPATS